MVFSDSCCLGNIGSIQHGRLLCYETRKFVSSLYDLVSSSEHRKGDCIIKNVLFFFFLNGLPFGGGLVVRERVGERPIFHIKNVLKN